MPSALPLGHALIFRWNYCNNLLISLLTFTLAPSLPSHPHSRPHRICPPHHSKNSPYHVDLFLSSLCHFKSLQVPPIVFRVNVKSHGCGCSAVILSSVFPIVVSSWGFFHVAGTSNAFSKWWSHSEEKDTGVHREPTMELESVHSTGQANPVPWTFIGGNTRLGRCCAVLWPWEWI